MTPGSAAVEFSPAWVEERWEQPPAHQDERDRKVGERAFNAIVARGQTPALIQVRLPSPYRRASESGEQLLDSTLIRAPTRPNLQVLRPALPDDCFPFSVSDTGSGTVQFLTGTAASLDELQELGERLLSHLESLQPPSDEPNVGLARAGVCIVLVDDGGGYRRAQGIAILLDHPYFAHLDPRLLVVSARHRGGRPVCSSGLGLIERDLPELRAKAEGDLSLSALIPSGPLWEHYWKLHLDGSGYWVGWIAADISAVLIAQASKQGGAVFELSPGEALPCGLALAQPEAETERLLDAIVERLRLREFWSSDADYMQVIAKPGELEFRTACRPVPAASDGSRELKELRRVFA